MKKQSHTCHIRKLNVKIAKIQKQKEGLPWQLIIAYAENTSNIKVTDGNNDQSYQPLLTMAMQHKDNNDEQQNPKENKK